MSAHCETCGIDLGQELECWACKLRAERDEAVRLLRAYTIAKSLMSWNKERLAFLDRLDGEAT